jgi:hypothetical protein
MIPSCGLRGLYESAGQNVAAEVQPGCTGAQRKLFGVAWGSKIAHTVSIETIEYGMFSMRPIEAGSFGIEEFGARI